MRECTRCSTFHTETVGLIMDPVQLASAAKQAVLGGPRGLPGLHVLWLSVDLSPSRSAANATINFHVFSTVAPLSFACPPPLASLSLHTLAHSIADCVILFSSDCAWRPAIPRRPHFFLCPPLLSLLCFASASASDRIRSVFAANVSRDPSRIRSPDTHACAERDGFH